MNITLSISNKLFISTIYPRGVSIQQPEVSALRDVDLISRMRSELKQLSTLEVGIEMPLITEWVRNTAPELCQFLAGLWLTKKAMSFRTSPHCLKYVSNPPTH